MIKIWKEIGATTPIRSEVGKLVGNDSDNTFTCTEEPDEIRRFSSSEAWGILLEETTDYTYESATVTLVATPATGTTIVAISDGEYIFENLNATGNSDAEADRTMEQQLFIEAHEINATDINISLGDYLSGYGLQTSYHYLAPDDDGSAGTYGAGGASLDIDDMSSSTITPFWVKVILPENTAMDNYHDVYMIVYSKNFSTHL